MRKLLTDFNNTSKILFVHIACSWLILTKRILLLFLFVQGKEKKNDTEIKSIIIGTNIYTCIVSSSNKALFQSKLARVSSNDPEPITRELLCL